MSNKEHFKVILENCGKGGQSKISVVKRKSDGKKFIWKRPKTDSYKHQESFARELKRAKQWRKFGVSDVKIRWHPDKKSLLKTLIKGPTLRETLKEDHKFFRKTKSQKFRALKELFELLVQSEHFIHDISPKNIAWDGKKWNIFDSGPIYKRNSQSSARKQYREKVFKCWVKNVSSYKWEHSEISDLKSFADLTL